MNDPSPEVPYTQPRTRFWIPTFITSLSMVLGVLVYLSAKTKRPLDGSQ